MAQNPKLAFPNGPNQDIWSYYKLLWIHLIVFHDHLVVILQVPLVIMNVYKVYNLPVLHHVWWKSFDIL